MSTQRPARQASEDRYLSRRPLPMVGLLYRGRPLGLYEVCEAQGGTVVLTSGPMPLPVGAPVTVDDLAGALVDGFSRSLPATVVAADSETLTLSLRG